MLADSGPWRECIRSHAQLIEIVKYRDAICDKFIADNKAPAKRWWEFWK